MLDQKMIAAMPTRQLLQIHASLVTLTGGDEHAVAEHRSRIEHHEAAIEEIETRSGTIIELVRMTTEQLYENGYTPETLAYSSKVINEQIDKLTSGEGDGADHHGDPYAGVHGGPEERRDAGAGASGVRGLPAEEQVIHHEPLPEVPRPPRRRDVAEAAARQDREPSPQHPLRASADNARSEGIHRPASVRTVFDQIAAEDGERETDPLARGVGAHPPARNSRWSSAAAEDQAAGDAGGFVFAADAFGAR